MKPNQPVSPDSLLQTRRILVCVGSGGVGKTTVAASLALEAARRGQRALVVTIDPARRLADALGTAPLGNEPRPISETVLQSLGVTGNGCLFAMMLDMKHTFDDLVRRFAESPEVRDRILENRIYQHVSDALAGSAEYAAMEKVFELSQDERFDLIVLDTPPSQHALDFLEAPERLLEFLDSRLVQILLHPAFSAGRFGFRLFHRSARRVLQVVERISGVGFLEDVSEFLLAFEGMSQGFRERARRVHTLLLGPESAFVLVAGPSPESVEHAQLFLERLEAFRVPLAGVVVNRMHLWPGGGPPPAAVPLAGSEEQALRALESSLSSVLPAGAPADLAARAAVEAVASYASVVAGDARSTAPVLERVAARGCFGRCVPEFDGDVHSLEGLARIAGHLFEASEGSPRGE